MLSTLSAPRGHRLSVDVKAALVRERTLITWVEERDHIWQVKGAVKWADEVRWYMLSESSPSSTFYAECNGHMHFLGVLCLCVRVFPQVYDTIYAPPSNNNVLLTLSHRKVCLSRTYHKYNKRRLSTITLHSVIFSDVRISYTYVMMIVCLHRFSVCSLAQDIHC